jgi:dihydrofolate reductase
LTANTASGPADRPIGKVVFGMTMSLDGFVSDRDGSVQALYADFDQLRESDSVQDAIRTTGAVVMGRTAYEMAGGDFTGYEFQVPIFVLTHEPPTRAAKGENDRLSFTFVTDGIERAIQLARAAAGDKDVTVIGGAQTAQQGLRAGLFDELQIDVVPILLGGGLRLFEQTGDAPIVLETTCVAEGPGRTHLTFRVVR